MFHIKTGTLRLIMSTLLIATTTVVEGRVPMRALGTSGCCSWGEAKNYCGDPPGDVTNWCSTSKDRCEDNFVCKGNEAKWLPNCEPLESKGCCTHHTLTEEKDCWCSIKSENCDNCGGKWYLDGCPSATTAKPDTTAKPGTTAKPDSTAKPGTCFTCSEIGEYRQDCLEGFHAPCNGDDHRYIECTDNKFCYDRPCAPGTSRSLGTCPEEEQA